MIVAAETPEENEVTIIDEQVVNIPWHEKFDLVGITCMTALAPRAYEIAAQFRRRNIPVVLGGMHPTLCQEEAVRHADAIVAGDVEGIWREVLTDVRKGKLKKLYTNSRPPDLAGLKRVPRYLLHKKSYSTINAVQATRGCPNSCEFCSVSAFHKQTQRQRPVDEVIAEVTRIADKFILLVDDNLTADVAYAARLFEGLKPLNKLWATQSDVGIAEYPDLVGLAAESGCIGLFVGIETFSKANLNGVAKTCNRVEKYREAIRLFHSFGIAVEAGIVFGFDNDRPMVFQDTLRLLDELEIDLIQASIFTPLPGTKRFESMQDRIYSRDWADYDFHSVVFHPKHMSAADLQAGHDWITCEFYKPRRIAKRLWRHALRPRGFAAMPYLAAVNLAYYGRVLNWHIQGLNPAGKTGASTEVPGCDKAEFLSPV
ncbi:MAG: radical SAM protein [Deltaproteobacteria bacterium]